MDGLVTGIYSASARATGYARSELGIELPQSRVVDFKLSGASYLKAGWSRGMDGAREPLVTATGWLRGARRRVRERHGGLSRWSVHRARGPWQRSSARRRAAREARRSGWRRGDIEAFDPLGAGSSIAGTWFEAVYEEADRRRRIR